MVVHIDTSTKIGTSTIWPLQVYHSVWNMASILWLLKRVEQQSRLGGLGFKLLVAT